MDSQYVPNQMPETNIVANGKSVYNQLELTNESSMDSLDEVVEFIHDHAIAEGIDLDALEAPWSEPVFEKDNIDVFDLADPMSTDTVTTLLQICEYCKGAFTSDHEYSSHSCHMLQKVKKPPKTNMCTEKDCKNKNPCSDHGKRFKMLLRSPRISERRTDKRREDMSVRARNDHGHHTCHICNKTLSRRSSLLIHMRRHTGETPYECDYCKKKFVVLYDLDRHVVTHVGAKKYSCYCDICRKPFVSKSGLLQHKQFNHNNLNLYPCNICGEGFTRKSKLITHKIAHETKNAMKEMIDNQKKIDDTAKTDDLTDMLDSDPSNVQVLCLYDNHVLTT